MTSANYAIDIDLDDDGVLGEAAEAVLSDVASEPGVHIVRGRDYKRPLGPPQIGGASFNLLDDAAHGNGGYQPGGSKGLTKGQTVRVRATDPTTGLTHDLFKGFTHKPRRSGDAGAPFVEIECDDLLSLLGAASGAATTLQEDARVDECLALLADAIGWPKNIVEYVTEDVAQAPAVYWTLGDAAMASTVADASGNSRVGTPAADATLGEADLLDDEGRTNCKFSNTINSKITLASGNGMPTGTAARTFLLRIRFGYTAGAANTAIWGYGVNSGSQAFNLQRHGGNDTSLYLWGFSNDVFLDLPAGANFSDGEIHTVIVTLDSDGVTAKLYWDGALADSATFGAPLNTGDGDLILGQTSNAGAYAYLDEVSHFAVWSGYAVTAAEAAAIHNRLEVASRRFDTALTTLLWWWLDDSMDPWEEVIALRNAEGPGARVYVEGQGTLVFKNRHARNVDERSTDVQTTFRGTGTEPLHSEPFVYDDGKDEVYNAAQMLVTTRSAKTSAQIWSLGSAVTLAANETRKFVARAEQGVPFTNAVTPTSGVDFNVTSGSLASVSIDRTSGGQTTITVTAGAGGGAIDDLALRAQVVSIDESTTVATTLDTSASQALNGIRNWDFNREPIRNDIDLNVAQDIVNAIPAWYEDGRARVSMTVYANRGPAAMTAALAREIGDRIAIHANRVGLAGDEFTIEAVEHWISEGGSLHVFTAHCEEAGSTTYFTTGISELDGPDAIGF